MKSVACLPHDKNRKICISGGKSVLNVVFFVRRASNVSVQAIERDRFLQYTAQSRGEGSAKCRKTRKSALFLM